MESQGSFFPTAAGAMAVIGLLLGLLGVSRGTGWFATGGFLSLLAVMGQSINSMADVAFHVGYWLALLFFFCAVCLHAYNAVGRRRAPRVEEAQPRPQAIV